MTCLYLPLHCLPGINAPLKWETGHLPLVHTVSWLSRGKERAGKDLVPTQKTSPLLHSYEYGVEVGSSKVRGDRSLLANAHILPNNNNKGRCPCPPCHITNLTWCQRKVSSKLTQVTWSELTLWCLLCVSFWCRCPFCRKHSSRQKQHCGKP